uniref:Decapping nuclease n=1 Tax=Lepeophtheirus salmonis TaxID=72036 RepID=D3PG42_LEPSM|nr:Dom3Z [Lepeophtheirus salmonis]
MKSTYIPVPPSSSSFPSFKRPSILGSYGQNEQREWIEDPSSYLKTFDARNWFRQSLNKKPLDLNRGKVILKDENHSAREGITSLLEWLRRNPQTNCPDFVLFRGVLTMLMKTPYERREPWCYSVVKYRDTIYLKAEETEYARNQKDRVSPFIQKTMEWGYKFEHILSQTSDSNMDNVINTNEEYDSVYRTELEGMAIIYGAEMDAIFKSQKPEVNVEDFVEFKTSKEFQNDRNYQNFVKYKVLKWWCQSFLVGITTIVCGFRDDDGFVRRIEDFSVRDIPKLEGVTWKPNVCMGFLKNLLKTLKNDIILTPNIVYNVSFDPPGSNINTYETDLDISHVLPSWYTENTTKS